MRLLPVVLRNLLCSISDINHHRVPDAPAW